MTPVFKPCGHGSQYIVVDISLFKQIQQHLLNQTKTHAIDLMNRCNVISSVLNKFNVFKYDSCIELVGDNVCVFG